MAAKLSNFSARVEPRLFRAMLGLPRPVQRRLAGRPVVRDGQTLDPEAQWMLRIKDLLKEPAAETLPLDAARKALLRQSRLVGGSQPIGEVREVEVPGASGPIDARLYVPRSQVGSARQDSPLLFFIHGGGMMYCDLDSHDPLCRFLAERADVRVLSIDYRLAPEHPFPAAVDDCWAAYQWVSENAERFGVDPSRIAVGGDSAGGYLSAVTALSAAEAGVPCAFQLLLYPVTNMADPSESRRMFGDGFFLTTEFIDRATTSYLSDDDDRRDARVSLMYTEKIPSDLAPAFVATAGFDPLRDEGEAFARLLADAGVPVQMKRYPGLIHGFANMVGAGRTSKAAVAELAVRLQAGLART